MDLSTIMVPALLVSAIIIISVVVYCIVCYRKRNIKFYHIEPLSINSIHEIMTQNGNTIFRRFSDSVSATNNNVHNKPSFEEAENLLDSTDLSDKFERSVLQIESSSNLLQTEGLSSVNSDFYYSPSYDVPDCQHEATFFSTISPEEDQILCSYPK